MKRVRAFLVAALAGSLLVAIRKRRRPLGTVVDGPVPHTPPPGGVHSRTEVRHVGATVAVRG